MSETVQDKRDKALEEVRAVREANERRAASHNRTEIHDEVEGVSGKPIELHSFGGRLYLNSHGESVLDQDAVIDLRRKLDAHFQAVS